MKYSESARIIKQERLASDVFSLWIEGRIAEEARPGQFIAVYTKDPSRLLPRPISICETEGRRLRIVYRIAGEGTRQLSGLREGDTVEVTGPLGNGFPAEVKGPVLLIGGGIGIPPMLFTAKSRNDNIIVLGYRDPELFLLRELSEYGRVHIAVERPQECGREGSEYIEGLLKEGIIESFTKGNVLDAIRENGLSAGSAFACGPAPMLRAVKEYCGVNGIEAWVSLEERMACGIGACLACVCGSRDIDPHSGVRNKRICAEGPVFKAEEVII